MGSDAFGGVENQGDPDDGEPNLFFRGEGLVEDVEPNKKLKRWRHVLRQPNQR